MPTSQYDVQNYSGVSSTLNSMPMSFRYYTPDIDTAKKLTETYFWSRPTITWSLSCEANG